MVAPDESNISVVGTSDKVGFAVVVVMTGDKVGFAVVVVMTVEDNNGAALLIGLEFKLGRNERTDEFNIGDILTSVNLGGTVPVAEFL